MSKDILGTKIEEGQLALLARSSTIKLIKITRQGAGALKDFYTISSVVPPEDERPVHTSITSKILLVLDPFLNSNEVEHFLPSCGNIKNKVDITGLPLKMDHLVGHIAYQRGGYFLKVSKVVGFGPMGGTLAVSAHKLNGEIVPVMKRPPNYVSKCLVLNEDLDKRLMMFRLMAKLKY